MGRLNSVAVVVCATLICSSALPFSVGIAKRLNVLDVYQQYQQQAKSQLQTQSQQRLILHQQQQKQVPPPQQQRQTTRETNTCEERKTSGPICESCELLSTCVRHSDGWFNIPVETCDTTKGFYCNSRLGMCSNTTGPCHPFGFEGNFQCTSHGIFPDPYDCQKYHVCHFMGAALIPATVECVGDKAFNAATGQCSLNLQDSVCQQKQFECENAGDAAPWPSNPNIFYICKATSNQDDERVLYPSLYRCADGEIFDGYFCRQGDNTPVFPTIGPPTTSTTNNPTNSTGCMQIGLTPDPNDCHRYYYCSAVNGILRPMECPPGTYYSATLSACTLGTC